MNLNEVNNKLVSIGIPTYNRPKELENILELITNQSYKNIEIIISDNQSDNQAVDEVVQKYVKADKRIKYFKQETNIGILRNYQFVFENSTGEYFTWVSDDDWRSPEFIEELLTLLLLNKESVVAFCEYHEIYENGNFAHGYPFLHYKYLKIFQSKYRIVRILRHYWQNTKNGKCNLFYGLFRRKYLESIDFTTVSKNFRHLAVDNVISFKILQLGSLVLSNNAMCCITCQNKKLYLNEAENREKQNFLKKFLYILYLYKDDFVNYYHNTSFIFEKIIFTILFLPKVFSELTGSVIVSATSKVKTLFRNLLNGNSKEKYLLSHSENNFQLDLKNVTLVSVDTRDVEEALAVLLHSSKKINFGKIKLLSHYTPFCKKNNVSITRIPKLKTIHEWCYFILYELHKYIETDYILLVHVDGYVVNPEKWRPEFLNYDYIGAPWPIPDDDFSFRDYSGKIIRVGNSVSIRSKKILELPSKLKIPWVSSNSFFHEDGFLCCVNRHILEQNGISFAPLEVAKYFAHEHMIEEIKNIRPFAFHKWMGTNSIYPNYKKLKMNDRNRIL